MQMAQFVQVEKDFRVFVKTGQLLNNYFSSPNGL